MAALEYSDISIEHMGHMNPGRIKISDNGVDFKNSKTGKLEHINSSDVEACTWIRMANRPGLVVQLMNGNHYRFGGFTDPDEEKLRKLLKNNWNQDLVTKGRCVKGWNFGDAMFDGSLMKFRIDNHECFEIPLDYVSNSQTGKNEVTLEFHQNDDAPVSLCEMRFYIPPEQSEGDGVQEFYDSVMAKAGIIHTTGTAIATLKEISCATPRGRYDIKIYSSFIQFHGKTFDYKIPVSTILRLLLLPHKDGRRMFFVISLDPPIKQGQTRYHFLILEFNKEDDVEIEPGVPEEVLREKFGDKLTKENMCGPLFEVVSRIMKTVVNRKITVPGSFVGHSGTAAISCAYKQAAGFLYPLERGFIYVHKPPIHIRFEEISGVNFARSDVSTRSFDFDVETKNGSTHTFTSIEKEEYSKLYDFVSTKKLRIRNVGRSLEVPQFKDDFEDSGDEDDHDPYRERLKKEAKEREDAARDTAGGDDDYSESDDSDFDPDKRNSSESGSEPDEEYDSEAKGSSSNDSDYADDDDKGGKKPKKAKATKRKHEGSSGSEDDKPLSAVPKKPPKKKPGLDVEVTRKKRKAVKDPNAPKRPLSAYFLWFGRNRESIREEGMTVTDIAKKAGQLWKELTDKTEWEQLAAADKVRYEKEMTEYREKYPNGPPVIEGQAPKRKVGKVKKGKQSSAPVPLSKETVSDSDDSDDSVKKKDAAETVDKAKATGSGSSGSGSESAKSGSGHDSD